MSTDLDRALQELAEAAADRASRRPLAQGETPAVLRRVVARVRRRRAARAAGTTTLAVTLVAAAIGLGLALDRSPVAAPPAATDGPTSAGPTPEPSSETTGEPLAATVCGASDAALSARSDPVVHPPTLGVTAPPVPDGVVGRAPELTATVLDLAGGAVDPDAIAPVVVLARDHVIVGGASFVPAAGARPGADAVDFVLDGPLTACPSDGESVLGSGREPVGPGDYAAWVVVTAPGSAAGSTAGAASAGLPGLADSVVAIGGPFAVRLTE